MHGQNQIKFGYVTVWSGFLWLASGADQ